LSINISVSFREVTATAQTETTYNYNTRKSYQQEKLISTITLTKHLMWFVETKSQCPDCYVHTITRNIYTLQYA